MGFANYMGWWWCLLGFFLRTSKFWFPASSFTASLSMGEVRSGKGLQEGSVWVAVSLPSVVRIAKCSKRDLGRI